MHFISFWIWIYTRSEQGLLQKALGTEGRSAGQYSKESSRQFFLNDLSMVLYISVEPTQFIWKTKKNLWAPDPHDSRC